MRRTKHVLFAFSPYTYKAVEAYLNRQAARGWALERIGPFEQLARFRRTDRTDLRCCTDLLPYRRGKKGRAKVEEYLALCREGGWELVDRRGALGVFVNRPGTDPAPIQTDREAERAHYRQVRRNSLFWVLIPLLIDLIYWIFLLWTGWRSGGGEWIEGLPLSLYVSWPRNWALIGLAAMLPLLAIPALLRLGGLAWSWVRAWRDSDIPTPAPWVMWGSALVNTAVLVALWIVLVVVTMEAIKQGVISCFLGMFIGGVCLIGHAPAVERMTSHPGEAWRMRGRGIAFAALAAVVIVLTLTVGGGGDQTGIGPAGRYDQVDIRLDQRVEQEYGPGIDSVTAVRYDCWNEALAERVADTLRLEAEMPERVVYQGVTLISDYRCEELAPVDFSWADEAWMGNWIDTGLFEGEGQVLIARRGLVILYLSAPMELTGNDVLRAFREQLEG